MDILKQLMLQNEITPSVQEHCIRFLDLLKDGPKQLSSKYLNKFFRSGKTRDKVLSILVDKGLIKSTKHSSVLGKCKTYYLNDGSIQEPSIELPIVDEQEFFDKPPVEGIECRFLYKGFKETTIIVTDEDKAFAKKCRFDLADNFSEHNFSVECIDKDWSQEKIWFLFDKLISKYPLKQIEDGSF